MDAPAREGQRGGLLVRVREDAAERLVFVPADVARDVTALPPVARVPGLEPPAIGIALTAGRIVTVLAIGDAREPERRSSAPERAASARRRAWTGDDWPIPGCDRAILCDLGGDVVALTGGEIVATGLFEAAQGGGISWRGGEVAPLDVAALYAQAEAAIWAARAARPRGG